MTRTGARNAIARGMKAAHISGERSTDEAEQT
jgi:hypothetical protein